MYTTPCHQQNTIIIENIRLPLLREINSFLPQMCLEIFFTCITNTTRLSQTAIQKNIDSGTYVRCINTKQMLCNVK